MAIDQKGNPKGSDIYFPFLRGNSHFSKYRYIVSLNINHIKKYIYFITFIIISGNHCYKLFVVQGRLSQQNQLLHDATDWRTMYSGCPCQYHHIPVMDHQTAPQGNNPQPQGVLWTFTSLPHPSFSVWFRIRILALSLVYQFKYKRLMLPCVNLLSIWINIGKYNAWIVVLLFAHYF